MNRTLYTSMAIGIVMAFGLTTETSASKKGDTSSMLNAKDIKLVHADSMLRLTFELHPRSIKPGSGRQVMFTPVVRSLNAARPDSAEMPPLVIAGRSRYYSHLREGGITPGSQIYRGGGKEAVEYRGAVAWQPWMEDSEVVMREETQNCCRPVKPLVDTGIATIYPVDTQLTDAIEGLDYVALTGEEAVELETQGTAYIDFPVNSTVIKERYRNNPQELKKITESIDRIKNDPDATITRLSIMGFASPEGPYDNNVRLSIGRTEALKEYVRKRYSFEPKIMLTNYEPEDWDGLREWLLNSDIANRDGILEIVNSDLAPDPKDDAIKSRYPQQYRLLLDSVYPALRHSDYTVVYRIKTYQDIEELKAAYAKTPERLRPVDFFRIAETYPTGSEKYEEVLLKASEIYPHNPEAAVNAANILMRRGDLEGASGKAMLAGESGEAYYTRGILAALNGDYGRAAALLEKASELGNEQARARMETLPQDGASEIIIYTTQQ